MNASSLTQVEPELTQTVSHLAEVARADTVYRDLYLRRARELLAPVFAETEYRRLHADREALDDLFRQIRSAVTHRAWVRVQSLVDQVRPRKQTLEAARTMLDLGATIYDVSEVPLAPFSPGLPGVTRRSPRELGQLKDRVVRALGSLERHDPGCRDFYAGRRSCLQALTMTPADSAEPAAALGSSDPDAEVARALDRGDLDRLERLAERMLATRAELPATVGCRPLGSKVDLARSFPGEVEHRARKIGLRAARVDVDAECAEYLNCCCVWLPSLPARPLDLDTRASHGCACAHVCPPGIAATLKDTLDLLIVHPFVNSAGERYLPRFEAETVLVEDFAEDELLAGAGELSRLLGLTRRTGVSRVELETVLLRRGPEILQDLVGLDPGDFRLVCIPFDIYSRLAPGFGWGRQPRWTHFDGYQVWKANRLRALVGGDVRYGGGHNICSIGVDDEREEVVTRFAVVWRERFAVISAVAAASSVA